MSRLAVARAAARRSVAAAHFSACAISASSAIEHLRDVLVGDRVAQGSARVRLRRVSRIGDLKREALRARASCGTAQRSRQGQELERDSRNISSFGTSSLPLCVAPSGFTNAGGTEAPREQRRDPLWCGPSPPAGVRRRWQAWSAVLQRGRAAEPRRSPAFPSARTHAPLARPGCVCASSSETRLAHARQACIKLYREQHGKNFRSSLQGEVREQLGRRRALAGDERAQRSGDESSADGVGRVANHDATPPGAESRRGLRAFHSTRVFERHALHRQRGHHAPRDRASARQHNWYARHAQRRVTPRCVRRASRCALEYRVKRFRAHRSLRRGASSDGRRASAPSSSRRRVP